MDGPDDERCDRSRRIFAAQGVAGTGRHAAEEDAQRGEAHEAQLGRGLQIQRVGVAHGLGERPLAQPVGAEGAAAVAAQGSRRKARTATRQYS